MLHIKYLPRQRTSVFKVEHLVGVKEFSKGGNQFQTLASAGLDVDEY